MGERETTLRVRVVGVPETGRAGVIAALRAAVGRSPGDGNWAASFAGGGPTVADGRIDADIIDVQDRSGLQDAIRAAIRPVAPDATCAFYSGEDLAPRAGCLPSLLVILALGCGLPALCLAVERWARASGNTPWAGPGTLAGVLVVCTVIAYASIYVRLAVGSGVLLGVIATLTIWGLR